MMKILSTLLLIALPCAVLSQEFSFSQYYLDKLSVSPALVSVGNYSEIGLAIRSQWPGVEGGYKAYMAEYQQKLPAYSCGIGARIQGNVSGGGAFSTNSAHLLYGYDMGLSPWLKCSVALEAGYTSRSLHQGNLVYYSMIDPATGAISAPGSSIQAVSDNRADFGVGAAFYTRSSMLALGIHRMAQVDISGDGPGAPAVISALVNHKIILAGHPDKEDVILVPTMIAHHSRYSDAIMMGAYFAGRKLLLSLAYRLERSQYTSGAVVTGIGIDLGQIEVGIGHDFDTSALIGAAHGSTEAGIRYKMNNSEKNSGSKTISCPAF